MADTTRTFKDQADLQGLTGDAIVELMILDLYPIDSTIDNNMRYVRFCNWTVADGQPVYYGADEYIPLPFQSSGWQMKGNGVPPNPSITVGNIGLEWSGLINTWEDLIGAKITRRRVLARYLSTTAGATRTDHWPDEIWFIQQKESENKLAVTFRLASAFDLDGIQLPRRRTLRYTCPWAYRGPECGYTGPPAGDINDNPWSTSGRTTPEWVAYEAALADYRSATTALNNANTDLANKIDKLGELQITYNVLVDESFSDTNGSSRRTFVLDTNGIWVGTFDGVVVYKSQKKPTSSSQYRVGDQSTTTYYDNIYKIRRYTTNSTAINTANAAVSTARATSDAARTTFNAAKAALDAAEAALLVEDPNGVAVDVCGKRLQSCRLRFGNRRDLPFGGFPGLYLT